MAARAIWRAELSIGPLRLPVKLYSAIQEQTVHFRLLHARDQAPVKQELIEGESRSVSQDDMQRGFALDEGTMVILKREELEALEPPPSRKITLDAFIAAATLDLRWFDRPYYLGPDGDDADVVESYFALARTLEERRRLGIAHWVMRRKQYQGALYGRHGYLVLHTLRHAEQLVAIDELRPAVGREPDRRELALAEQLVSALQDRFDPTAFRDEYRQRVLQLIEAKAKGKVIKMPRPKPRPRAASLVDTLEASVRAARGRSNG